METSEGGGEGEESLEDCMGVAATNERVELGGACCGDREFRAGRFSVDSAVPKHNTIKSEDLITKKKVFNFLRLFILDIIFL